MDDLICEALGRVLQQDEALIVYVEPPEAVNDYPAALVLETEGVGGLRAYRGGWGASVTVRVVILVRPRVELPEAISSARPWVRRGLALFLAHDELKAVTGDIALGDLTAIEWSVGQMVYADTRWSSVEFELTYETDVQIAVTCDGIGTYVDTHTK
jgi:hypothetical protein